MKPSLLLAVTLSLSLGLVAACGAPIRPVAYSPNPQRVANPPAEVKALILANTVSGCVTEPEFTGRMLVVKFVCTSGYAGVGNRVVRFDRIVDIKLEESGGWYRVLVKHSEGTADFDWTSRSLEDMRRLADALSALAPRQSAPPRAPGTDV